LHWIWCYCLYLFSMCKWSACDGWLVGWLVFYWFCFVLFPCLPAPFRDTHHALQVKSRHRGKQSIAINRSTRKFAEFPLPLCLVNVGLPSLGSLVGLSGVQSYQDSQTPDFLYTFLHDLQDSRDRGSWQRTDDSFVWWITIKRSRVHRSFTPKPQLYPLTVYSVIWTISILTYVIYTLGIIIIVCPLMCP